MKRLMIAGAALSAMLAFGCDDKNKAPTPEAQKTADKAADTAADKMGDVKSAVNQGTDEAKDKADNATDAAKNRADAIKDQANKDESAMKNGADANQNSLNDLISKAKDAIKDKKWTDADNYVQQIEDLKGKLPTDQQPKVDSALTEVKAAIAMGKKVMPGT